MMNDTFMKEKPVLPLILSMLVNFSIQHYRQPFRRADQRGSYDGIIIGLPGSKFYQCCWNWIWRCYDSLLYYNDAGFFRNVHFIQDSD